MSASVPGELLAKDVCKGLPLPRELRKPEKLDRPVDEFLHQVVDAAEYVLAIRILSRILPSRDVIWWGMLCVWKHAKGSFVREDEALLGAIFYWVRDPTSENQKMVRSLLKSRQQEKTPATHLARAVGKVGWAPSPGDPLNGNATTSALSVSDAIFLALAEGNKESRRDDSLSIIAVGLEVRASPNEWVVEDETSRAESTENG